jgi:hypothetical protein
MVAMTEEWVSLWYQCLAQNIDYSLYCNAREVGDHGRCVQLEARFEKLRSIYDDFGPLDGWPEGGTDSQMWSSWFQPRAHLFLSVPRHITGTDHYVHRQGYLLLEVPLQPDAESTTDAVGALLKRHYLAKDIETAPAAKYVLNAKDGRPAHGLVQVRQACRSVARSYRYSPETFEELRHHESVAAFVRHEIDNMGWNLDPKGRAELARSGILSEQRLESFKAMLNKCRRDFRAFSANTIRASFPDDRPFASAVLDIH